MNTDRDETARSIVSFYGEFDEDARLRGAFGELEFARTCEVVRTALPASPATVLDLGGACGPYAFWMAGRGYVVDLVDLVPRHLELANARQKSSATKLRSIQLGDARSLAVPGTEYDFVLLHGPLYHLPSPRDRRSVLLECSRILKANGALLAFAISRYAGLLYALPRGLVFDERYRAMIRSELASGCRANRPEGMQTFPTAYFHTSDELVSEIQLAGLAVECRGGVAGPVWQERDFDAAWCDEQSRSALLELSRDVEVEPALSPSHYVRARKPAAA